MHVLFFLRKKLPEAQLQLDAMPPFPLHSQRFGGHGQGALFSPGRSERPENQPEKGPKKASML